MPEFVASELINPTTRCEVQYAIADPETEETVTKTVVLGYYRSRINKKLFEALDAINESGEDEEVKRQLDAILVQLVGWWNVRASAGGDRLPITIEAVHPLDQYFVAKVVFSIIDHYRGKGLGEVLGDANRPAPSSPSSAVAAPATTSQAASTPKSTITSTSQKSSHQSSPGNGRKPPLTTMKGRSSGQRRKVS